MFRQTLKILTLITVSAVMLSCTELGDDVQQSPIRYDIAFYDEFDGPAGTLPDAARWVFDIGTADNGWGNGELQYYTDRPENASLDGNGNLVITAQREDFEGAEFTSARLKSRGLFEQEYGLFEARIRLPGGTGIWPAFWMLGNNCEGDICGEGDVIWPEVGEIDVVELFGSQTSEVAMSVHGPGYSGGEAISKKHRLEDNVDFTDDFHVYTVEWDPSRIQWSIDGVIVQTLTIDDVALARDGDWVFNRPFFMLLNVAVGGGPVGDPDVSTQFPAEMVVDYVRVFTRRER